jgi:hypothetical protein
MLLAAQIAQVLQIHRPTMLTDNKMLAKAVESKRTDSEYVHWNCRDSFAHVVAATSKLQAQVFHKRDLNGIAHSHQVLRKSTNSPTLGCTSSAHSAESCPVIYAFQTTFWLDFVIHTVHCC